MYVRDIMTTNVLTIPSSTSVAEARRIMEAHGFRVSVSSEQGAGTVVSLHFQPQ